jgi:hypothetical protein
VNEGDKGPDSADQARACGKKTTAAPSKGGTKFHFIVKPKFCPPLFLSNDTKIRYFTTYCLYLEYGHERI